MRYKVKGIKKTRGRKRTRNKVIREKVEMEQVC